VSRRLGRERAEREEREREWMRENETLTPVYIQ